MNNKYRRAINFDLSEELLKLHYPKSIKNAWKEVGRYLKDNGFKHRQYSGYVSKNKLSDGELLTIVYKMWQELPWLEYCATKFDVTNIGEIYDLLAVQLDKTAPGRKEKVYNFKKGRVDDGSAFSSAQSNTKVTKSEDKQKQCQFKPKR